MPFESIRKWQYLKALNKLPSLSSNKNKEGTKLNPALQYLLFFDGTDEKDVSFFQTLHREYEKRGLRIKILAFVRGKEGVQHFAMAMYNEKSVQWNYLPKSKIVELVQSRHFDILFNINTENFMHLHYLAVASTADFKVSTQSDLPNDFDLTVKTKPGLQQGAVFREMEKCLDTLSV